MSISEITRRNILDTIKLENMPWNGRLSELEFLSRLYNLQEMPSNDERYADAETDIWQHRIRNYDGEDDWVFYDGRFGLFDGPDRVFLNFLCEMIHPVVRPNPEEVQQLLKIFNDNLTADGWEIAPTTTISGRPVYSARLTIDGAKHSLESAQVVMEHLSAGYIAQQITRIQLSVDNDPELAIGTAKEFVETVCKTILDEKEISVSKSVDFPSLVRKTIKELKLAPDDIPDSAKASESIRVLLSNLATIANKTAEIRGAYGTGHGKSANAKGLRPRHARLAVGAATTLAVFLFETYKGKD